MKVFSSSSLPFGQRKESEFLILRLSPARNKFAYSFCWIWNRDSVFFPKTSTTLPCCHTQLLRKFSVQAVYPLNKKMKSISKFWYSHLLKINSPNFLVEFKTTNYFLPRLCITLQFHDTQHLWTFLGQAIYSFHKSSKRNSKFWASCQLGTNSPISFAKFGTTISFYPNRPSHFSLMTRSSSESFQFKHITLCIKPAWNQHVSWNWGVMPSLTKSWIVVFKFRKIVNKLWKDQILEIKFPRNRKCQYFKFHLLVFSKLYISWAKSYVSLDRKVM